MADLESPQQIPSSEEFQYQPLAPQTFLERHDIHPVLFGFVSLLVIFVLYQIAGSLITLLLFGLDLSKANVTGLRIATGIGQIVFILIPTFILARLATFTPNTYLRLTSPNPLAIVHAIVGVFSLQQILQVYLYFQEKVPLPEPVQKVKDLFKEFEEMVTMLVGSHSPLELVFVVVIIAVVPAIAEEFFFRGLIQRSFEKGLGTTRGFILTGIIFGAYHLNPFSFIPLAILGVYLGFLAVKSDSIWVSSSAHFFNNAMACIAVYMNMDEDSLLTGNPETMSPRDLLLWAAIMATVFAISTMLFLKTTKSKEIPIHNEEEPPL